MRDEAEPVVRPATDANGRVVAGFPISAECSIQSPVGKEREDETNGRLGCVYGRASPADWRCGVGGHYRLHGGYCAGTEENDVMNGTDTYDLMHGLGGDDNMFGHFGHDEIYGGQGADFLLGDEDYDYPDTLLGNDTLYGGPGNDDLRGAFGNDKIYGGEGDDFVFAYDQLNVTTGADVVACGGGVDTVHYDKGVDKIRHCEIKVRTTQN